MKEHKVKGHMKVVNNKNVRVKTYTRGGKQTKKAVFTDPKYQKYSDMVELDEIENAKISANKLEKEFEDAKTKDKKLRVARVTQFSAVRARAMSRNPNISKDDKKELQIISRLYGKKAVKMWKQYRKL